jgi:hypothetical protein
MLGRERTADAADVKPLLDVDRQRIRRAGWAQGSPLTSDSSPR